MHSRNRAPLIVLGIIIFAAVALFVASYAWIPKAPTHVETIELDPAALSKPKTASEAQIEYP